MFVIIWLTRDKEILWSTKKKIPKILSEDFICRKFATHLMVFHFIALWSSLMITCKLFSNLIINCTCELSENYFRNFRLVFVRDDSMIHLNDVFFGSFSKNSVFLRNGAFLAVFSKISVLTSTKWIKSRLQSFWIRYDCHCLDKFTKQLSCHQSDSF